jgi:hypothetical protein
MGFKKSLDFFLGEYQTKKGDQMEVVLPIVLIACIVMFWLNTWFKG